MRAAAIVIGLLDALACGLVAIATLAPISEHATAGFDSAAATVVVLLFVVTGLPALVFAMPGRAPKTALTLALTFPAVLFGAVVFIFARLVPQERSAARK